MQMAYNNKNMLEAGMMVAGWDKHGGGQVWSIPLGGSLLKVSQSHSFSKHAKQISSLPHDVL